MRYIKIIMILGVFLILSSQAIARPLGPPAFFDNWKAEDTILGKLDLTPEQSYKIAKLRELLSKDSVKMRTRRYEHFAEIRLLWMEPNPDFEKIKKRMKEIHELIWEMIEKGIDYRIALREILTGEQYKKLLKLGGMK